MFDHVINGFMHIASRQGHCIEDCEWHMFNQMLHLSFQLVRLSFADILFIADPMAVSLTLSVGRLHERY